MVLQSNGYGGGGGDTLKSGEGGLGDLRSGTMVLQCYHSGEWYDSGTTVYNNGVVVLLQW
jgi:hypothetical protein